MKNDLESVTLKFATQLAKYLINCGGAFNRPVSQQEKHRRL